MGDQEYLEWCMHGIMSCLCVITARDLLSIYSGLSMEAGRFAMCGFF